ncbi:hypothetical protein ACQW5G_00455 [Fructilactobacillus sp. Tb1]|uniref:hypothetical protein n=1 Tax=Fructilactobacillus sp. Tb1 TaxID=3422304 RepID=UPI003D2C667E
MHVSSWEDLASILAIITAVGSFFFGTYVLFGKLSKLIDSINELNGTVKILRNDFNLQQINYTEKFTRDDERINNHETRIKRLEDKADDKD